MSSLRKVLCIVLVLCLSGVTAGPLAAQTTPAPAAPQGASDPWPRQVKSGTTTFLIYQPQLDSWSANQLEGHAAVAVKTAAAKDPTFGVIWFTARTEVDKVNRVVFLEDLNITRSSFPSAPAQRGGVAGGPAGERAGQEVQGHRPRPPRGRARHPHGQEDRRVPPAEQRAPGDPLLERSGRPRARRRRARLQAADRHLDAAAHQHERDRAAGQHRRAVLPPLRRLADGGFAPGPVEGRGPALRPQGRHREGLQPDHRGRKRRSDDGGIARRSEGSEALAQDAARPGRLHGDAADRAHRRRRPAQLRPDPEHAAALRDQHDGPRVQGHRQPEHVRAHRRPLVQRGLDRRALAVRAGREPPARLREDPRREPDGEREVFRSGNVAGAGGGHRQQHPADGERPAHVRRSPSRSRSTARRS